MKIKQEHFDYMKKEIDIVLEKYNDKGQLVEEYRSGNFPRADKVKDLQKRFCFDLFFGAGLVSWSCNNLCPYLNDDHIYTALKKICPQLEEQA